MGRGRVGYCSAAAPIPELSVSVFMRFCQLKTCRQVPGCSAGLRRGLSGVVFLIALTLTAAQSAPAAGLSDCRAVETSLSSCPAACPVPAEVWAVSTRRLPGICGLPATAHPGVERYDGSSRRWLPADLGGIVAGEQPLVIFIHGNRYDPCSAKRQGLQLARRCAGLCGPANAQTLVYSWPSQQDGRLLKDGRSKYRRCYTEGYYLAWLLGQLAPDRPVVFVGYSFGALITLEALDNLLTAEAAGLPVSPWRQRPGETRLVFIAPAVRCDAFAPCGPYRETLDCVDCLSLTINSRDDALRFFHLLDRYTKVDALGHTGMPQRWVPAEVAYSAVDARRIVGREHGFPLYLRSTTLMRRICGDSYGTALDLQAAEPPPAAPLEAAEAQRPRPSRWAER